MKVLFTHSYFLRKDAKQWRAQAPYPPLGTLYACAAAQQLGFEVHFFDVQFCINAQEILPTLKRVKPDFFVICDDSFNYLSKMCLTNMREAAFEMIGLAKLLSCKVLVASSDASDHAALYLQNGADGVVIGEAEETIGEWLKNGGQCEDKINGLTWLMDQVKYQSPPRKVKRNLDEWPLPAWSLLNFEPYQRMWLKARGYTSINLVTTRGCPYKCNWCAKPVYGNRYNSHSPEQTIEMIKTIQQRFGVHHIWFADDIFGLKPGWVNAFADLIQSHNIQIKFKIQSRADLLVQTDTVNALKRAGCLEVWMGAESGSQKILDAMDKGVTVAQIHQATQSLKNAGIRPCLFLQFGYPGEQMIEIKQTFEMVKAIMPYDIGVSVSYPLPGTIFYERVKHELVHKQNWKESDDLEIMFSGSYPIDFYKKLQRLMHYKFRTWNALLDWSKLRIHRSSLLLPYYSLQSLRFSQMLKSK